MIDRVTILQYAKPVMTCRLSKRILCAKPAYLLEDIVSTILFTLKH